jgi:hypothetical protein
MQQKLEKWLRWIEEIHKDAEELLQSQYIFSTYLEIIKNNPDIESPSDFHWWTRDNYVSYIAMSIRRQAEWKDPDIISLGKLLHEMQQSPEVITRQWYKDTFQYDWSDSDFSNVAGTGAHFDPLIAQKDLETLTNLSQNIIRFTDRKIAHKSKQPAPTVKFEEVDVFIAGFEKILKNYILLFTASGYTGLRPIHQYDWEEIFTKPWIKKQ